MASTKLVVKTDVGTFTRRSARTYTHIVVVKGERFEVLEARRLAKMAGCRRRIAEFEADLLDGGAATSARFRYSDGWYTVEKIEGYLAGEREDLAALDAAGPVVEDQGAWGLLGWCGRLDLARKLTVTRAASTYRTVRIYDVATGAQVGGGL